MNTNRKHLLDYVTNYDNSRSSKGKHYLTTPYLVWSFSSFYVTSLYNCCIPDIMRKYKLLLWFHVISHFPACVFTASENYKSSLNDRLKITKLWYAILCMNINKNLPLKYVTPVTDTLFILFYTALLHK